MADVAIIASPQFLKHQIAGAHPESPERYSAILSLIASDPELSSIPSLPLQTIDKESLSRTHTGEMVNAVLSVHGKKGWLDEDTYYGPESVATALAAVGSTVDLALKIQSGELRRGFAIVRPPGHHATPHRPMGFCLFNTVACVVTALRLQNPESKIAIVDFDLHHGNGTQDLFYDDPNVLFISSHRFPFYPGTGSLEERGEGKGKGTTLNFPIAKRVGRELFLPVYEELVLPVLKAFRPDFILVSAGYDGHAFDPMQGFRLSDKDYGDLSRVLIEAAEETTGKILFCLEGGYNPSVLATSVRESLLALKNTPHASGVLKKSGLGAIAEFDAFRDAHRPFFPEIG